MKRLLILFALAWLSVPSARAAETLSQLITDARVLQHDAASNTRQRFTDAQITEFINQGQREALAAAPCLFQNIVFTLSPGTTYYPLPSNYTSIRRVTVGSKWIQELSPGGLDGRSRGWEAASGYPTYYFVNFSSRGLVGFAPWPAQAADTDTVKVEYNVQATDLAAAADLPFNGVNELQDYHHALAYFAAAMMAAVDEHPSQSSAYMGVFSMMAKQMGANCTQRPNYLPSAVGTP